MRVELFISLDSGQTAKRTPDPLQPVIDQHADLGRKAFLATEPDQIASAELDELGRPSPDGHQPTTGSTSNAADRKDRPPFVNPAQMPPVQCRGARLELREKHVNASGRNPPDGFRII